MNPRSKPRSGEKNELEEIGCHFINLPDNLFMGILSVCGFVVWGRQ